MGVAVESEWIESSLGEVWDLYFERDKWPNWVDGFVAVESERGYPEVGGMLVWRSTPAGRGTVTEEVLEHESRRLHRIAFSDPESEGELATRFEIDGEGVTVSQKMDYRVLHRGLLGPLTDIFFVRRQVSASLARSLEHLKHEAEGIG